MARKEKTTIGDPAVPIVALIGHYPNEMPVWPADELVVKAAQKAVEAALADGDSNRLGAMYGTSW